MSQWSNSFPSEEGLYWFYGDLYRGYMGKDFENYEEKPVLSCVQITKFGNFMAGVVDGQIIYKQKFDLSKRLQGWYGLWLKVELPQLPEKL